MVEEGWESIAGISSSGPAQPIERELTPPPLLFFPGTFVNCRYLNRNGAWIHLIHLIHTPPHLDSDLSKASRFICTRTYMMALLTLRTLPH